MAESKALSTPIKGGLPSNPKDLKQFIDKLQISIDLVKTALKQKDIEPEKYREIIKNGQEWAGLKLQAELKLKDYIIAFPKETKWDKNQKTPKGQLTKGKDKIIKELGLTKKQATLIKRLTPDGVDLAIKESKEVGDLPTRHRALHWSGLKKDQENNLNPDEKPLKPTEVEFYKMQISIKTNTNEHKDIVFNMEYDFMDEIDWEYNMVASLLNAQTSRYLFMKSPFNYPGSKAKLIRHIFPYLTDYKTIVSPFLGGGTIEVNLVNRGHSVIAYDYDPNICNLWFHLLEKNAELKKRIHALIKERIEPFKVEDYKQTYKQQLYNPYFNGEITNDLDKAAMYWILLMTSYGAMVESRTPDSKFFKSTNHNYVEKRIKKYNKISQEFPGDGSPLPDITAFYFFGRMSFEESIPKHPEYFLYCDPPYFNTEVGYGDKEFDHKLLAGILNDRKNWILSYNDCPEIRKLYKGHEMEELNVPYPISNSKDNKQKVGQELLIFGPTTSLE